MIKFIELMNTSNSKERFRIMLYLKIVFKLYAETLTNGIAPYNVYRLFAETALIYI